MRTLISSLFIVFISLSASAQTPAFPGAEGAGMFTTGGRGGKVLYVTSLEDNDSVGTLRWAIRKKGPRTILFNVSGIIQLNSPLFINNGDVTIAGQSAPGDGICISNHETIISADNVIVRYLRFRLGDGAKEAIDAFSGKSQKNIIIDHCSMSWSVDECSSFYDNENFTMQWCLIAESLRNSAHVKGEHGYGGIWGGKNVTFHHNLLVSHDSRNPRFCGSRYSNQSELEKVDFRNNVIYNWGANNAYAAEGGSYNLVNNYYKPGPASKTNKYFINPYADDGKNHQPAGIFGRFYLKGNVMEGNRAITKNNVSGVKMGSNFAEFAPNVTLNELISNTEFSIPKPKTQSAKKAYQSVLKSAGCSLVRDVLDMRYVNETRTGTFTFKGSKGSSNGLIDSQNDVGGWPVYNSLPAPPDTDGDGIPDGWLEKRYPGKKSTDLNKNGYTYLEVYLNSIVKHIK
ncbi:MAG: pectate lyase [Bacteroidia bacterium]|nr:pectate lyase [Bacteroidia bacterium]